MASYTNFPHFRVDIPVTVGVDEDLDHARRTLQELIRRRPEYLSDPEPVVVVTKLNDYNVELELRAWLNDERQHMRASADLREAVYQALKQAGVDMPCETFRIEPVTVLQEKIV